jgi:Uncharacterized protein conserved in bacteria (DUF2125)
MQHWTLRAGLTLGAILIGSTAFALTPEELWTKYQDTMTTSGQTVAVESEARNGDVLELRGVTITASADAGGAVQTIPEIDLTDNGDGTVGIGMSDTITIKGAASDASPASVDMTVTQTGFTGTASGTVDALLLDYGADATVVKGTFDDGTGPTTIDASLANSAGSYGFLATEFQTNFATGAGTIVVTSPSAPFPVNIGFSEIAGDIVFPTVKADAPSPFTFLIRMVDFTLPEEVWAMSDPTGQLPRDPATLVIDTTGMVRLLTEFADEPAPGETTPPPEFSAVTINEIRLNIAGADLTGNGDLTLDNTDMTTFSGMPAPTGILNFTLTGGNGLLDKLAAMGVVPEDQLMGVRMMMGMFATMATDGSDTMTSVVEFKDKGLFVNGQQLQ